ncbi:aminotransferase class IV, partial [Candidatus Woesebacteria bacterium]|nr:aminotransferase class IV [Candidatus Woesebacteria bacterium]
MSPNLNTPFPFAHFEKGTVKIADAKVSIMTKSMQYGMAWFGGVRGYMSEDMTTINIFRLDDHIQRFLNSAKILGVSVGYSAEELRKIFIDLTKKNQPKT